MTQVMYNYSFLITVILYLGTGYMFAILLTMSLYLLHDKESSNLDFLGYMLLWFPGIVYSLGLTLIEFGVQLGMRLADNLVGEFGDVFRMQL